MGTGLAHLGGAPEASGDAGAPQPPPSSHGPGCACTRCTGFLPGHRLSLRHGARSVVALRPRVREIAEALAAVAPVAHEADGPAVELLATMLARLEAVDAYVGERGLVDGDGRPHAVLSLVSSWEKNAGRLLDRLGMTSAGRADLGLVVARAQEIAAGTLDYSRLDDGELAQLRALVEKATA
jgi:hypothetical protein